MQPVAERRRGPKGIAPSRTLTVALPSPDAVATMSKQAARDLFVKLALATQEIVAAQAILAAHLAIESEEPLMTAKEVAAILHFEAETIRDRGAEWGIQADLGEGTYRYIPERVRGLRDRLATPKGRH
jgi:hypothetical protein